MSFGFKASRSGAQHEEELYRKVAAASSDYESKVHIANALRHELATTHRLNTVHALMEMIHECDSFLTVQLQRYGKRLNPRPGRDSS